MPATEHGQTSASTRTIAAAESRATPQASGTPRRIATQSSLSQFMPKAMTPARQNTVDEELAKMIASDFQPLSVVEDKGFRSYTHALNPIYAIPSKNTLSQTIIPRLYDRDRASLRERVKNSTAVCLTTDCWRATTSFMSVTCHFIENYIMVSCLLDCFEFSDRHTSENLAEELKRVASRKQSGLLC